MLLIVGLGNPGLKYRKTRHNLGSKVLDEFRKENDFPKFKFEKKFQADINKGLINNQEVILAKPRTFMNSSGRAVKALANYYKIPTENITVVHDDIDIPLGEIKLSQNRGAAGHKGVESIIQELGTQNFTRLRLGIAPKAQNVKRACPVGSRSDSFGETPNAKDFVLKKFSKQEKPLVEQAAKKAKQLLRKTLGGYDMKQHGFVKRTEQ